MSKTAAVAVVKGIVDTAARIASSIEPFFKIEGQDLTIAALERRGSYSVFASVKTGWRKQIAGKIRFNHPEVFRLDVRSLPMGRSESPAIQRTGDGFELNPKLLSDCNSLLLQFDFTLTDDGFVEALVKTTTQKDTLDDRDEYWISAQLKHPEALKAKNYNIDLRDIDFNVDVAVHQDISDVVPNQFLHELQTISKWIQTTNRSEKHKYSMQHIRQRSFGMTGKEADILSNIQDLFLPSNFQTYVKVQDQFRFAEVRRGLEFYDNIPNRSLPKTMTVISRTDLNLESFAAKGLVKYEKLDFRAALEKLFPKAVRKAKR